MGKCKNCNCCCCSKKEEPLPTTIRVGPDIRKVKGLADISLGRPYASWDDVPKEVLDVLVRVHDTTLFERKEAVERAWNDLDPTAFLHVIKTSISTPKLRPEVEGWIWFPKTPSEGDTRFDVHFAYCRLQHNLTLDYYEVDKSK